MAVLKDCDQTDMTSGELGKVKAKRSLARVTTLSAPLGSRLECFRRSKHGVAKPLFRKFIVVAACTCCNSFNLARYSH
jgi:hypothetical protein